MKRFVLFIFVLCMTAAVAVAQETVEAQQTEVQPQSTGEEILEEIRKIREIQQVEMRVRDSIAKDWRQHRHDQAAIDSLSNNPNQLGAMLQIENNTHQDWWKDGWNLFGVFTFLVALFSLIVGWITYDAQKKTEEHTRPPLDVQLWRLRDLPRHFYRNLVCTCAVISMFRAEGLDDTGNPKKRGRYPSESNLVKMFTLPDDIILSIDVGNKVPVKESPYSFMYELRLLLRNYNIEVETASNHLARETISNESLAQDFDNLLFKPIYLTRRTFDYEKSLPDPKKRELLYRIFLRPVNKCLEALKIKSPSTEKESLVYRTIVTIVEEHFRKLRLNTNFDCMMKRDGVSCLTSIKSKGFGYFDEKGSIDRSVDNLLAYGYYFEKNWDSGISYSDSKSSVIYKQTLREKLDIFILPLFDALSSIADKKSFVQFYADVIKGKRENKDVESLYDQIYPYLDYLRQDTWEFHTLLKYMLAVDAAIETDRIGMVNFS